MAQLFKNQVFKDIHDYGIIGNLVTCALIGIDGSVDWLCLPFLESPSIFAALLDLERGGHFSLAPAIAYNSMQSYLSETNILETTFFTALGKVVVTDFMPVKNVGHHYLLSSLYRKVECKEGAVPMELLFKPRFDYARATPNFTKISDGVICSYKEEKLSLNSSIPLDMDEKKGEAKANFLLNASESKWFCIYYGENYEYVHANFQKIDFLEKLLHQTSDYWKKWVHASRFSASVMENRWHDILVRSGLILKLLSNPDSGAIAAAATTSLPEKIGGVRNWDYRYAWIRDASFTVQALYHLGHDHEVNDYRKWIEKIVQHAKDFATVNIMYGVHTPMPATEEVLSNLSGYKNSTPVRIGNAAVKQKQHDIFGELVNVIYETSRYGKEVTPDSWAVVQRVVDHVCKIWNTPDSGIWEVRGGLRHFIYSKVMCWNAIDKGIKIAHEKNFEAPLSQWEHVRDDIKNAILSRGYSAKLNSFRQSFDDDSLDSSNLLIPILGFLPVEDARVQSTIDATIKHLSAGHGLLYRYRNDDGLAGDEGCFLLCSFWLIKALALSKRFEEADLFFSEMLKFLSPLGILSEEVSPTTGEALGNFPQAFSHIGLINAALYLGITRNQEHKEPRPMGIKKSQ